MISKYTLLVIKQWSNSTWNVNGSYNQCNAASKSMCYDINLMFVIKSLSKSELNETEILLHEVVIYTTRGLNLCTMNVSLGIHLGNF